MIPELVERGRSNVAAYNYVERNIVEFHCHDGAKGWEECAPYDGILCSAALPGGEGKEAMPQAAIPDAWKNQLRVGGNIVAPVGNSLVHIQKDHDETFSHETYPGFAFVPLVAE